LLRFPVYQVAPPERTGRKIAGPVAIGHAKSIRESRRALRIREFCEQYGLSRSYVYKLIALGKLKTICVGRRRLVPVDEAERLLREGA
jgi:excisionase family DNA binding protein